VAKAPINLSDPNFSFTDIAQVCDAVQQEASNRGLRNELTKILRLLLLVPDASPKLNKQLTSGRAALFNGLFSDMMVQFLRLP
jgi:hypothetical protein